MAVFPLLADPASYRACETDLLRDEMARDHWLNVFERQLPRQLDDAATCGFGADLRAAVRDEFLASLNRLRHDPSAFGRLDILTLDMLRQEIFRKHGIEDECRVLKQRANDAAIGALPQRLRAIDAITNEPARLEQIIRGMLAGNLFDTGAAATAHLFGDGDIEFDRLLTHVPDRPWLVDDFDQALAQWRAGDREAAVGRAVVFADNAGPDFVLGLIPLVRAMLQRQIEVILTANSAPSHNDITHDEIGALMPRLTAIDETLASPQLRRVPSGNDAPLIDLTSVSDELTKAAVGADLIVLLGMGRALETNYTARFTCPCWRVAMVKDEEIARTLNGRIMDAVFRMG